jgi:hypothetical protein
VIAGHERDPVRALAAGAQIDEPGRLEDDLEAEPAGVEVPAFLRSVTTIG